MTAATVTVALAFGDGRGACEEPFEVAAGTTLEMLLRDPRLSAPIRDAQTHAGVGVWGRVKPMSYVLRADDRIEFYQPLKVDPKEQRRLRKLGRIGSRGKRAD
jgi:putative ubiquitin-RnfH superfamily antitoxin RatB of RatAB toxin-antitoxin module